MKERAAKDYERKHIGQFVVITKKDKGKATGIFKYVTPDFNLYIEGKHGSWRVDPFEIVDFYGRPDRFPNGTGGDDDQS